jgi:hypothetical protein
MRAPHVSTILMLAAMLVGAVTRTVTTMDEETAHHISQRRYAVEPYYPVHKTVNVRRDGSTNVGQALAARRGIVRSCGNAVCDDDGAFPALGASLFWAGSEYQQDRAHLERNLAFLADYGFDYIRVLGEVGGPYWVNRWMDPGADDYEATISGLTDLAYDAYGLRVEWVIWGGTNFSVTAESRRTLVDRFARMAQGREHKIMSFEIANEGWQTGFPHPEGTQELRELVCRLRAQVPHLVAPTSPAGPEAYGQPRILADGTDNWDFGYKATYQDSCATLGTVHFDRQHSEDGWRPVRQPWYYLCCRGFMPRVGFNDEPIGPGSSVASEEDPLRLIGAAAVTWVSSMAAYTFHSEPGVWGGGHFDPSVGGGSRGLANLDEIPDVRTTFAGFEVLRKLTPQDIVNWSPKNWSWDGHPFRGAFEGGQQRCPSGAATDCAVGLYAMTRGQNFYVPVFGIKGTFRLTASWTMRATLYAPGMKRTVELDAGETLDLNEEEVGRAVLIVGGPQ